MTPRAPRHHAGHASKEVLRPLAAMAVLRQAGLMVQHHGIRCAHFYLSQSSTELPGAPPPPAHSARAALQ